MGFALGVQLALTVARSLQLMCVGFMLQISSAALELFLYGQHEAAKRGLLLVDTKYEFGKDSQGTIRLIDEIHTPDSSRYIFESDDSITLPVCACCALHPLQGRCGEWSTQVCHREASEPCAFCSFASTSWGAVQLRTLR